MQEEKLKVEEVEEEGQEIEVEDTEEDVQPESNENKPAVDTKKEEKEDDLSDYSQAVKKRISTLTYKFREEEKQRQAAVEFAESVKKQNDELKSKLDKLDNTYVGEFDTRVQSQSIAAKEAYRKAVEENDVDAMYDAQQNISRIAMEEARLNQLKTRREEQAKETKAQPQAQTQQPQAQAQPKPDPKAEDWASKNTWFGQDQTMTYAAFGLHKQLIEEEGLSLIHI